MTSSSHSANLPEETVPAYQRYTPVPIVSPSPDGIQRSYRSDDFSPGQPDPVPQGASSPASPPPYYPHDPNSYNHQSHHSPQYRFPNGGYPPTPPHSSIPLTHYQSSPSMSEPEPYAHQGTTQVRPHSLLFPHDDHTSQHNYNSHATTVPLHKLGAYPAPVICPRCNHRSMTKTKNRVGNTTHAWAFATAFTCCLCFLPYLMTSLKDIEHRCGKCNRHLATWHRSGTVEVLAVN